MQMWFVLKGEKVIGPIKAETVLTSYNNQNVMVWGVPCAEWLSFSEWSHLFNQGSFDTVETRIPINPISTENVESKIFKVRPESGVMNIPKDEDSSSYEENEKTRFQDLSAVSYEKTVLAPLPTIPEVDDIFPTEESLSEDYEKEVSNVLNNQLSDLLQDSAIDDEGHTLIQATMDDFNHEVQSSLDGATQVQNLDLSDGETIVQNLDLEEGATKVQSLDSEDHDGATQVQNLNLSDGATIVQSRDEIEGETRVQSQDIENSTTVQEIDENFFEGSTQVQSQDAFSPEDLNDELSADSSTQAQDFNLESENVLETNEDFDFNNLEAPASSEFETHEPEDLKLEVDNDLSGFEDNNSSLDLDLENPSQPFAEDSEDHGFGLTDPFMNISRDKGQLADFSLEDTATHPSTVSSEFSLEDNTPSAVASQASEFSLEDAGGVSALAPAKNEFSLDDDNISSTSSDEDMSLENESKNSDFSLDDGEFFSQGSSAEFSLESENSENSIIEDVVPMEEFLSENLTSADQNATHFEDSFEYNDGDNSLEVVYEDNDNYEKTNVSDLKEVAQRIEQSKALETPIWYVAYNGESEGPMNVETLLKKLDNYQTPEFVYLWKKGFKDWQNLFDTPQISSQLGIGFRRHERFPFTGTVKIEFNGNVQIGQLENLSVSGLGATGFGPLVLGETVKVTLDCTELESEIEFIAKIRFTSELGVLGLSFVKTEFTENINKVIELIQVTAAQQAA